MDTPIASERFVYAWRYTIDPACRPAFVAAYKPGGEWAQLFWHDPAYLETILFQDVEFEDRYVTINFWKSKADRDSFRGRYLDEFDALDSSCGAFTKSEQFLGDYLEIVEAYA